ncbi:MAG: hypothetical protein LKJ17_07035 [Oscillospiraceae bacterium]|jgi:hypothetical protein|nr:hypothetical protein [Oscillospiraceae bacterium]
MKTIIDGKLYDTEQASLVAVGAYIEVYRTQKGNWFKKCGSPLENSCRVVPVEGREAQSLVGLHAPDEYEKYFGRPEEA